jgi:hypothetical protein
MFLQKLNIKNNRQIALDVNEIIALDFNESMKEIKLYLRGGGLLTIEGKKAAKIWKHFSENLPDLLQNETDETDFPDLVENPY